MNGPEIWINRALAIILWILKAPFDDRAVELQPDNPDFRETRGMIYFNLGRWDQAIEDLEIAVNGVRDLDSIHRALAESYRKIGNPQLAEVYERQIRKRE